MKMTMHIDEAVVSHDSDFDRVPGLIALRPEWLK